MKRVLLIFTFISQISIAQKYQPFDTTVIWRIVETDHNDCFVIHYNYVSGYVLNNGLVWCKVYTNISQGNMPCSTITSTLNEFVGLFANDTVNRKVFFVNTPTLVPNFVPGNNELLFDFNHTINSIFFLGNALQYKITNIDSILLGAKYHKVYSGTTTINSNYSPQNAFIIEGIGSSMGVFIREFNVLDAKSFHLTCFSSNNFSKYVVTANTSILTTYPIAIRDTNTCSWFATRVASYLDPQLYISSFPNPANDVLNIKVSTVAKKNFEIKITDVSGRQIEVHALKPEEDLQIRTEDYNTGVYFIQIIYNKKLVETRKLVVSH